MAYHGALTQQVRSIDQILPHEVFRKREGAQDNIGHDLETGHVPHCRAHDIPDQLDIDAAFVGRQRAFEGWNAQLEVLPQQLDQGEVETRFILMLGHDDPRNGAFTLQLDRQKDQRSAIAARILRFLLPLEEAKGQKQRVGAPFGKIAACLTIKVNQGRFEFALLVQ